MVAHPADDFRHPLRPSEFDGVDPGLSIFQGKRFNDMASE